MYVWNGFPIVSKRKDLSENLLVTVEKSEAALQNESKYEKQKPGNLFCFFFFLHHFPVLSLCASVHVNLYALQGHSTWTAGVWVMAQRRGGTTRAAAWTSLWGVGLRARCQWQKTP